MTAAVSMNATWTTTTTGKSCAQSAMCCAAHVGTVHAIGFHPFMLRLLETSEGSWLRICRSASSPPGASQSQAGPAYQIMQDRAGKQPGEPERGVEMIISDRKHVQFRGVTCTRQFDYYATPAGCVKCRVTFIPVARNLRHLRGHSTCQLLNLALIDSVQAALMFLGLQLDDAPAAGLFTALASAPLAADADATLVADYLNA